MSRSRGEMSQAYAICMHNITMAKLREVAEEYKLDYRKLNKQQLCAKLSNFVAANEFEGPVRKGLPLQRSKREKMAHEQMSEEDATRLALYDKLLGGQRPFLPPKANRS